METTEEPKPYEFKMQKKFIAAEIAKGVNPEREVISIDVVDAGYSGNGVMGHKLFLVVYSKAMDGNNGIHPLAALPLGGLEVSIKEVNDAAPLGILHYIQATKEDIPVAKQKRKICLLQLREAGYKTNKPKRVLSTAYQDNWRDRLSLPRTLF